MSTGIDYIEHRHGVTEPVVALTFDDGPSEWTEGVLEQLGAYGARGTFFVVGSAIAGREVTLRRMISEGSEVGNHTYTHRSLLPLAEDEIHDEIERTSEAIERVTAQPPRLWRAPHFASDPRVRHVAAELGLLEVRSSVIPADYVWPAAVTAAWVLNQLEHGSIVDLHDGRPASDAPEDSSATREATVAAVARILPELGARGYRAVTVSELLALE